MHLKFQMILVRGVAIKNRYIRENNANEINNFISSNLDPPLTHL